MVVQSLEKSGYKIFVRENLEKSNFTERAQIRFLYTFIIANSVFSEFNTHYTTHIYILNWREKMSGISRKFCPEKSAEKAPAKFEQP